MSFLRRYSQCQHSLQSNNVGIRCPEHDLAVHVRLSCCEPIFSGVFLIGDVLSARCEEFSRRPRQPYGVLAIGYLCMINYDWEGPQKVLQQEYWVILPLA